MRLELCEDHLQYDVDERAQVKVLCAEGGEQRFGKGACTNEHV